MFKVLLMTSCATALLAGCVATRGGDYCAVTRPIQFGSAETIETLIRDDRRLVEQIIAHNETVETICR